jgi:FAD/FMN-containing dehydrogenase
MRLENEDVVSGLTRGRSLEVARPRIHQEVPVKTGSDTIAGLREVVRGRVIGPHDDGYDEARTVFVGGFDLRPVAIVRVVDATDVARGIGVARETGVELAVRSGGHSGAGHSTTEGGIVLDLRDLKALDIDAEGRTAWAQTGLTAGEYTAATDEYGLATGFGDTGSVGIGGITLGGGVGYLTRKHGLTIDSLLEAEVVTADGEILRVDHENHPDLFWAIRGGGGNFGVATRFRFRLHEVGTVVGGMLFLPATAEIVARFIEEAEAAPEELSTIANVMPAPPMPFVPEEAHGKMIIMAMLAHVGDVDAGERAVAPFRALATPIADMVRPMRYPEMFPPEDESYHPTAMGRTMFVDRVDHANAGTIMEHLEASDASLRVAQLRVLGGAMARVPADAAAFAHRASKIMVNVAAFYDGPEDKPLRGAWVDAFAAALRQNDAGAYVNFLSSEGEEGVRAAYPGATWDRLAAIKARYDPTNLFRLNQNVPPAEA